MPASNSDARKRHEEAFAPKLLDVDFLRGLVDSLAPVTEIVGFSGWAQSGKDTMSSLYVAAGYEQRSFAEKLRELAYAVDPYVLYKFAGEYFKVSDLLDNGYDYEWLKAETTFREFLQDLGNQARNVLGDTVWVDAVMNGLGSGKFVFSDVRYPNEADAIRMRGGKVYRINRVGHQPPNDHVSEHALDDYMFDGLFEFPDFSDDLDGLKMEMLRVLTHEGMLP